MAGSLFRGVLLVLFSSLLVSGQGIKKSSALKVFIDCQTRCDFTYIRSEINQVDFLLDRLAAEVHILVTSQGTGSGGRQYQVIFYGQNGFKQLKDTIRYGLEPNATDFERRAKMVDFIRLGLVPYFIKMGKTDHLVLKEDASSFHEDSMAVKDSDPWNFWSFRLGGNGNLRLDQVYVKHELNGIFSINRITDLRKIRFWFRAGEDVAKYYSTDSLGNRNESVVKNYVYYAFHELVNAISDHWSYGYSTSLSQDTFSNYKLNSFLSTALEYSFFPYQEVNTRFLTFRYGFDVRQNIYYDTTIYNKVKEMVWGHKATLTLVLTQKWGNISSGLMYRNYFHDWDFYRLSLNSGVNVRITGGLSLNLDVYAGLEHDQINLVKDQASFEEVLTKRRQLGSSYRISSWFGLNYRFGSKSNNFINPRFDN